MRERLGGHLADSQGQPTTKAQLRSHSSVVPKEEDYYRRQGKCDLTVIGNLYINFGYSLMCN